MGSQALVLITDASPSINSSTSREVFDLVNEFKQQNHSLFLIYPCVNHIDRYSSDDESITCRPIFYKSKNLKLRFVSEIYISLCLSIKILFYRKKIKTKNILCISPSIFLVFPSLLLKKINRGFLYLMLRDMFPCWLADAGIIKKESLIFIFLKKIADLQMRSADRIGVESEKSKSIFLDRYPSCIRKAEVLLNWITTAPVKRRSTGKTKLKLIYAGSIGQAQGVKFFKALLMHLRNNNQVDICLVGRGNRLNEIQNFVIDNSISNFQLLPQVASKNFDDFLRGFDIGLFFLNPDLRASNIPGKFMSYVMNGLPVLGAVNQDNELISMVSENRLGYLDSSGKVDKFLYFSDILISEVREGKFDSVAIRERSSEFFSTQNAVKQLSNIGGVK